MMISAQNFSDLKVCFLSLGLIGGSIAKALRLYHPEIKIHVYNRSENASKEALHEGIADYIMKNPTDRIDECDIIFLCAPVEINNKFLVEIKDKISPECILTDVGSVKTGIHETAEKLNLTKQFIGGHPMTGSEKSGYKNASALLLENSYYILTPSCEGQEHQLNFLQNLISSLKPITIISDYKTHDFATAAISHVPHLIAATLVKLVEENDTPEQFMKLIAAGGFKDITRIAASSPDMWEQICSGNAENIITILDLYQKMLDQIKTSLVTKKEGVIYQLFEKSGAYRNSLSDHARGSIRKSYQLYTDIRDEAGAIAKIATILAKENISIKNIGITHNREHEEGILYIVFYDEKSMNDAVPVLNKNGYPVIER